MFKEDKKRFLILGILFDAIGMASMLAPGIGAFSDIIWAPVAAWLMSKMYKGKIGQAAGVITFIEEIIPGLDIIPTFTIMWVYTYVIKKKKSAKIINVKAK